MCGLAGFLRTLATPGRDVHRQWLESMGQAIVHRGPDASGHFIDDHIGLAHRRLSILDLSDSGTQPMKSATGRFFIVFNGEIYNYRILKQALEEDGYAFKTGTDTEVLLALFEQKGFRCLDDLNGMFAIAIWDTETKQVFLARDRLGKKPLYYYDGGGCFAFASEIKSLLELPFIPRKLRPDAIKDFFAYQYVPDPKTIFENVHKLPPGYWLTTNGTQSELKQYWDVSFSKVNGHTLPEIRDGLYDLIDDAVSLRMVSDVPLGAFLSGGVDSSAIVGLMANQSKRPVTTCSIGFDSRRFDEVQYASQVAKQFQTDHHEFTVRENVASHLTDIARFFDEPFADPSFVPTYFVSQLARRQVTVALAGDGGDENFAGYSKYRTDYIENRLRNLIPKALRIGVLPWAAQLAGTINLPVARKAQSLLGTLALEPDEAFFITNSFFRRSVWDELVTGEFSRDTADYDPADITRQHYRKADTDDHLSKILYTDIKTYLPGDILVKVDRMSMAHSLETRAPLLDYRVVEYAAGIPSALKMNGKEKKFILKDTFSRLLPDDILYRKKMGFSVPLAEWLRTEIRPAVETAFHNENAGLAQIFNINAVRKLWQRHLAGDNQYTQEIWSMLAFELWWQAYSGEPQRARQ
ncbi:asparagine synthase (glutamine-hydrolyzing) [Marinobacter caseinilyticus]|uniref:asparagine synthase (glutamine-hydrolyzing) n=1 Tax=Marinobacter caseinilyticus TaxID=2692195 RepID=UPI00140CACBB|nr:asparagine synthase (glutamine-hydrolyzing) [Marinobacter caseinilyticus]